MQSSRCPLLLLCLTVTLPLGCHSFAPSQTGTIIRGQDPGVPAAQRKHEGQPADPDLLLPIHLHDAISSALDNSSSIKVLGSGVDLLSITPYDLMIAQQRVPLEQGRFQPQLALNYDGSQLDQPPSTFFGPGIPATRRRHVTDAGATISKLISTGGTVTVGAEPPTAYLFFPDGVANGSLNPRYSVDYVVRVSHPVLQGAGTAVTQAPIRIAQLRADQSQLELEDAMNDQIRSVTEAYWQLYAAHLRLQAIRTVLPLAEEVVRIEQLRLQAEQTIPAEVARAKVALEGFRRDEASARGVVRKRSLELRQLVGAPATIQPILVPADQPLETEPAISIESAIETALEQRPSLQSRRQKIRERQIQLQVSRNQRLPSLDLRGEYRMEGLAERLDDSFSQASTSDYTDWTLGFGLNVPLGNQVAKSRLKIAELELSREIIRLEAEETQTAFEISDLVSGLQTQWERAKASERQLAECREWMRVAQLRYTQPHAEADRADSMLVALNEFQTSMQQWVSSISTFADSLAEYNSQAAQMKQVQGISRFAWESEAISTIPGARHVGPGEFSYRSAGGEVQSMPGHTVSVPEHHQMTPMQAGHSLASPRYGNRQ